MSSLACGVGGAVRAPRALAKCAVRHASRLRSSCQSRVPMAANIAAERLRTQNAVSSDEEAAEVDELSREFAIELALAADEVKAVDIIVLDVSPVVSWADYFVVSSGFSRPQMDAICTRMMKKAKEVYGKELISGRSTSEQKGWVLLDYGDVVAHVFSPQEREFYNIERFYSKAHIVPLPFETESSIEIL